MLVFFGGPPAHTFAAVMPLPEGASTIRLLGCLLGEHFRPFAKWNGHFVSAEADFCIVGKIHGKKTKPEGPLEITPGYYSLTHDFPVLEVEKVFIEMGLSGL